MFTLDIDASIHHHLRSTVRTFCVDNIIINSQIREKLGIIIGQITVVTHQGFDTIMIGILVWLCGHITFFAVVLVEEASFHMIILIFQEQFDTASFFAVMLNKFALVLVINSFLIREPYLHDIFHIKTIFFKVDGFHLILMIKLASFQWTKESSTHQLIFDISM